MVKNARLATNRENVTLVSSGGSDGNAPGVWQLLKSSVLVGLSQNNVADAKTTPGAKDDRVFNGGVGNKFPHYKAKQEPIFCK